METKSVDIVAEMKAKKITQQNLGKMLRCSQAVVSQVIGNKRKSKRIRAAISLILGKPVSEIFPDAQKNTPIPADPKKVEGDEVGAADPSRD